MSKTSLRPTLIALILCVSSALAGCNSFVAPDKEGGNIGAPCVKPLIRYAELEGVSITSDGTKALVTHRRGYEMRMFIADLPSASITRRYYGSPSKPNGLQDGVLWIGDSKTRFWGSDNSTIGELDENLNRTNVQPCPLCGYLAVSKSGRFATASFQTQWRAVVFDRLGGEEIGHSDNGSANMSFSPDDRYLAIGQYNTTWVLDITTKREFGILSNKLSPVWLDNATVLLPDETQPIIWEYNVETGAKKEFIRLRLAEWRADQQIIGVTGNGPLRYLMIIVKSGYGDRDLEV